MADIPDILAAGATKIVGSDSSGVEQTPVQSTSAGGLHANVRDNSGAEVALATSTLQAAEAVLIGPVTETAPANDTASSGLNGRLQRLAQRLTSLIALLPASIGQKLMAGSVSVTVASDQTVPVSAASLPLPAGASTAANQATEITALQILDDVPTAQNGAFYKGTPVMGQLDDTSTTAATEDNVAALRITAQRAAHVNLRNNAGTEVGTSGAPVRVDPTGTTAQPVVGNVASGSADSGAPVKIGGVYNAIPPTVASGSRVDLQLDSSGRLLTSAVSLPTSASKFSFGDVTTAAQTQALVLRTTYTEQTTNAQRSLVSASASDAAAGTGARTVRITYLDQTGAGPFTETVTLNGTTPVNTVSTTICFIEKMEVLTVGSTSSNVGIISLKAATAGGGVTIGTIAATDNQTIWGHHYVPTGKTCYISGFSVGSNSTTTGGGAAYVLKAGQPTVANTPELQVSDFVTLYGQSSTNTRPYDSPIQVAGPARIRAYVTPTTSTSTVYRASFDFIDN